MDEPQAPEKLPLGFIAFVILAGLYLAVRLFQGVAWVVQRLT